METWLAMDSVQLEGDLSPLVKQREPPVQEHIETLVIPEVGLYHKLPITCEIPQQRELTSGLRMQRHKIRSLLREFSLIAHHPVGSLQRHHFHFQEASRFYQS